METTEKPTPTFEVRLIAPGISPAKLPLRAVSDVLSAVQDLASGRDPFEMPHVPPEKSLGLIDVSSGSALYRVVSRAPQEALLNLRRVGTLLTTPADQDMEGDGLVAALRPIESLSVVCRAIHCRVEVGVIGLPPLFSIGEDDYKRISSRLLLRGETTVIGTVERVGGATGMRCLLRVPNRRTILYCDVDNRDLVRRLGQHLYEEIAATGTAIWIHRSWRIYKFTVRDFKQPKLGDPKKALKELREAGLKAWDNVADPAAFIRELRQ